MCSEHVCLRGRTATQRSKKGSEKVLGRVLGKGSQKGSEKGACCGFYSKKRVLRRVLRRGSEKAASRRCLERSLGEYAPLGVRPTNVVRRACLAMVQLQLHFHHLFLPSSFEELRVPFRRGLARAVSVFVGSPPY